MCFKLLTKMIVSFHFSVIYFTGHFGLIGEYDWWLTNLILNQFQLNKFIIVATTVRSETYMYMYEKKPFRTIVIRTGAVAQFSLVNSPAPERKFKVGQFGKQT